MKNLKDKLYNKICIDGHDRINAAITRIVRGQAYWRLPNKLFNEFDGTVLSLIRNKMDRVNA